MPKISELPTIPAAGTKLVASDGAGDAGNVLSSDFATAAQGSLADTAVQPGDLAAVATSGDYDDLSNRPTLGTAAAADTGDFATAAQGSLADTALQSAAIGVTVQAHGDLLDDLGGMTDPGADRIVFWDDSAGKLEWLTVGANLSISGTTLNASGGGGGGGGDMDSAIYDPNSVASDVFDMDNMTDGSAKVAMTPSERSKLSGIEAGADVTDATNVAAAGAVMDGDFSADGLMARTSAGSYSSRTITGTAQQIDVTNGDGKSGNPTLALASQVTSSLGLADTALQSAAIGVTVQAHGDLLDDLGGMTDPGADRIVFWDDSAGKLEWLTVGANLSISGTTLNASGGGGDWEQIGAPVTASSGTSVAFTSIPADYTDLMIEVNGVRSTHTSNNVVYLDISSNNGSNWSPGDQNIGIIPAATGTTYGRITFWGYLRPVGAVTGHANAAGSDPGVSETSSYGHGTRHSAGVDAIRIRITNGAYTGSGTFTLFGRK